MPIDYSKYHPKWSLISRLIRFKRAKNRCEWCGVPNGRIITRLSDGFIEANEELQTMSIQEVKKYNLKYLVPYNLPVFTKIILTVAHIDRDKTNNRFNNLAALCQKCHLNHDKQQHINNRKYGRNHKDNQLTLNL